LRIKKQNYYSHKVMWDGWVNPEKHSLHIIGHWNYAPGTKKDIYVISTSDKVELKVNNQSLGYGSKSDGFLFIFKNVEWKSGSISAVGYDVNGKQICNGSISTVGAPAALRLTQIKRPTEFLANGQDLVVIEVEVVDAKGNRCPTALNMINYSLRGPAEWRGGMAMGPGNYILEKNFPVENGVNRFLIRSTRQAGTINVKATADGLKEAAITITSKPFVTTNGLSNILPSAGLPSKLERGPTPSTPSYNSLRTAINITSVIAGANADSAFASYDDNELSDWANDGNLSTAWIEYTLEREATVSEVCLKLNNFRSRVYPLRITVDGKEVFNDSTQRTLGYYTIACKPVKGKKVRIQLLEASKLTKNDATEVSGVKLDDGVSRNTGDMKGTLNIIEAEIYEAVKK
jgi:beta-galactosidase